MSRRVENAPEGEVIEVNSDDEGTIDLVPSGDEDDSPPPSPVAHPRPPEEEEENEEEEDEEALTNRQFNEMFVYHTAPQSPSARYPSPPPPRRLPSPNIATGVNLNDQNAPQNTTAADHHHDLNNEQLGNHQATETGKFSFNDDVFR